MTRKPKRSPCFQFYPSDFLGSPKVRAMNAEEIGVYMLCLCLDWEHDGFTLEDAQELAESARVSVAHFGKIWAKIARCFETDSGRFFNVRLRAERKKQQAWRRKSSKGGKLGAAKRWSAKDKGGIGVVIPNDGIPLPLPSPTPVTTTATTPRRAKRERTVVENWVAELAKEFRDAGGDVREGHLGSALKGAKERFGPGILRTAMGLWLAERKAHGWSCAFPKFAADHVRWCEEAVKLREAAESGVDYWDNDALQRITRPTLVA